MTDLTPVDRAGGREMTATGPVGCTPRGFAVYADFADTRGSQVRVVESSAAFEDHCWIFVGAGSAHLSAEQVRAVRDALSAWLANGGDAEVPA